MKFLVSWTFGALAAVLFLGYVAWAALAYFFDKAMRKFFPKGRDNG